MFRTTLFLFAAALAALIGFVIFQAQDVRQAGEPYGTAFELTAADGRPITERAFRDGPSAIFFGFTHCPEICPTTLYELDGWLDDLGETGDQIDAFFVTVDPERDTADTMRLYIANVTDRVTGITGDPDAVREMLDGYNIYYRAVEQDDGEDYTMDHTASVILLEDGGEFFGTIAWGENAESAKDKLRRLADG